MTVIQKVVFVVIFSQINFNLNLSFSHSLFRIIFQKKSGSAFKLAIKVYNKKLYSLFIFIHCCTTYKQGYLIINNNDNNNNRTQYIKVDIYQDLHGGRLDGDVDGVQVSLFNPVHPLDVHI